VDGKSTRSCLVPVAFAAGKKVVTLEGLSTAAKLHPLQKAFIEEQAGAMRLLHQRHDHAAAALLQSNRKPTIEQVREALAGNLCRCGTHVRILRASCVLRVDGLSEAIMDRVCNRKNQCIAARFSQDWRRAGRHFRCGRRLADAESEKSRPLLSNQVTAFFPSMRKAW